MKILYIIYQVCFALPILLVLTILTALVTIIGSLIGGAHIWGYYPGKIWSQLICYILLIPVEVHGREKIHKRTSYVFVPNHQGAFDINIVETFRQSLSHSAFSATGEAVNGNDDFLVGHRMNRG